MMKIKVLVVLIILISSFSLVVNANSNSFDQRFNKTNDYSSAIIKQSVDLFTLSFNGEQNDYSLDDLKDFPSVTGTGGRLKVTNEVMGPYEYTGVSILELANEFSSIPSNFDMVAISDDGYLVKFTFDQIQGDVEVYDLQGNPQGQGGVEMILAYAEDGEPLVHGGPLRIAFVNDGLITDAFLWSKYIEEIEFVYHTSDDDRPDISIDKPTNAIYYFDNKFFPYPQPVIIGDITFEISVYDENDIAKVIFLIDDEIKSKQAYAPYQWKWDERAIGKYTIKIIAYDNSGNIGTAQKEFSIINFF